MSPFMVIFPFSDIASTQLIFHRTLVLDMFELHTINMLRGLGGKGHDQNAYLAGQLSSLID